MTNTITEIKKFNKSRQIQPSGWNDNGHDYSTEYAKVNGGYYNLSDLSQIVGEEHDGALCPITDSHLSIFTEESDKGFFSINLM